MKMEEQTIMSTKQTGVSGVFWPCSRIRMMSPLLLQERWPNT